MKQRKKQLLTFLLLAAAILAFCLLWQPKVAHGVEIAMSVEIQLTAHADQMDAGAKERIGWMFLLLFIEAHKEELWAIECYNPEIGFRFKEGGVLILYLSCTDCQAESAYFTCNQNHQFREEVKKK